MMIIQKLHAHWKRKSSIQNEDKAFSLLEQDFEYGNTFNVSEELLGCGWILLRCEGLDTLADLDIRYGRRLYSRG